MQRFHPKHHGVMLSQSVIHNHLRADAVGEVCNGRVKRVCQNAQNKLSPVSTAFEAKITHTYKRLFIQINQAVEFYPQSN